MIDSGESNPHDIVALRCALAFFGVFLALVIGITVMAVASAQHVGRGEPRHIERSRCPLNCHSLELPGETRTVPGRMYAGAPFAVIRRGS